MEQDMGKPGVAACGWQMEQGGARGANAPEGADGNAVADVHVGAPAGHGARHLGDADRRPGRARVVALFVAIVITLALGFAAPRASAENAPSCTDETAVYAVVAGSGDDLGEQHRQRPVAYINDYVTLGVCHLDQMLASAKAQAQDVTLYINGLDSGLKPSGIDHARGSLTYMLDLTAENKTLWRPLLYNPFVARYETLHLSVGIAGGPPLPKLPGASADIRFNKLWVDAWTLALATLLLVVAVATVHWARHSDMLRDGPAIGDVRQSYSLGRVQMAWWFILIVFGYVAIWLVTGDQDTITTSLVALMGISAVTGVSAAVVTPSATRRAAAIKAQFVEQRDALDQAVLELDAEVEAILGQVLPPSSVAPASTDVGAVLGAGPVPAGTPTVGSATAALVDALRAKKAAREQERAQLAMAMSGLSPLMASRGFWRDLVTDDRGAVALDRLQVVVWTAVLSTLFLYSVLFYLAMPELSTTMLLLMGVSSGTYIGFKLPAARS